MDSSGHFYSAAQFPPAFVTTNDVALRPWSNASSDLSALSGLTNLSQYDGLQTNAVTNITVDIDASTGKYKSANGSVTIALKTGQMTTTIGTGALAVKGYGAVLLDGTNTVGYAYFLGKTNGAVILQR